MKTRLIAIFATLLGHAAFAQVTYDIDNHTRHLAPVKVSLALAYASGNQFTAGGLIQGSPLPRLFYSAEYRHGLVRGYSNAGFAAKSGLQTTQTERAGRYFEAGAEWAVLDRSDKVSIRVVTFSFLNYVKGFHPVCEQRKLLTVGGGVFSFGHNYYLSNDSGRYFRSGALALQPAPFKTFHSYIGTTGFFAGASYRKIQKAAVTSAGHTYRSFRATSWSLQVMTAPSQMQDITVGGTTYPITNASSAPLGYRVIWRADRGITSTCVELGKMPHMTFDNNNAPDLSLFGPYGISDAVNYFRISCNIILFGNDRKFGMK